MQMVFECILMYVLLVKFHVLLTPDKNRCAEMYSGSFSFPTLHKIFVCRSKNNS